VIGLGCKELNLLRWAYYPQLDPTLEGYFQVEAKLKVSWDTAQQSQVEGLWSLELKVYGRSG
jgi:hypothetical protein